MEAASNIYIEQMKQKKDLGDKLIELDEELGKLRDRQNQIEALHRKQDVQSYLRKMWNRLENSPSPQRRRVIQTVVKTLIYDAESEELRVYINPNLECHKGEELVRLRNEWRERRKSLPQLAKPCPARIIFLKTTNGRQRETFLTGRVPSHF